MRVPGRVTIFNFTWLAFHYINFNIFSRVTQHTLRARHVHRRGGREEAVQVPDEGHSVLLVDAAADLVRLRRVRVLVRAAESSHRGLAMMRTHGAAALVAAHAALVRPATAHRGKVLADGCARVTIPSPVTASSRAPRPRSRPRSPAGPDTTGRARPASVTSCTSGTCSSPSHRPCRLLCCFRLLLLPRPSAPDCQPDSRHQQQLPPLTARPRPRPAASTAPAPRPASYYFCRAENISSASTQFSYLPDKI